MPVALLTWFVEAREVSDARRDLAHDGLNLPHDLLVALLLDSPDEHQRRRNQAMTDTMRIGY